MFTVTFPSTRSADPLDGRLLLLLSNDPKVEPLNAIDDTPKSQIVFGTTVDGWKPGTPMTITDEAAGYPIAKLSQVPPGDYLVQAVLNRYQTFRRADGHTVKLPPDMGEGQHWNLKPGNFYSKARPIHIAPGAPPVEVSLDEVIPPIKPLPDTKYIRHLRIQSALLTKFWGTPMFLSAVVMVPEGFDTHPQAHYPLIIFHDHFATEFNDFRETPPDPNLKPDYSERFHLAGYNRIQQEEAYKNFQDWTKPDQPRFLIVKLQHANPFYDDSYAVNSANVGPYGDAIETELIPAIEKQFRGLGTGWARFVYGGSTGGWESIAVQMFYPDHYNGAFIACPDPVDFHAYSTTDLYGRENMFWMPGANKKIEQPSMRNYLGQTLISMRGSVFAGRRRRLSAADLRQDHRRHRSQDGRVLARTLRSERHPAARLGDAGTEAAGQAAPVCRLRRHLHAEQCGVPDGRLSEDHRNARPWRAVRGRGRVRTQGRALLEWRP